LNKIIFEGFVFVRVIPVNAESPFESSVHYI